MTENDKYLSSSLKSILNGRLPQTEAQSLIDEGFNVKRPTRKTAVLVALYKKAASGDLSAIKELISIVGESKSDTANKAVIIIDDLTKQAL